MAPLDFATLLRETYGAAYIGSMVSMVLYGITTLQTYLYFNYYPNDGWSFRTLVAVVWIFETLHVGLLSRFMYLNLIGKFADPLALFVGDWTLYISVLCNLIIATVVQIFFASRIHYLGKKWWLTAIIGFFIVAHVAFGLETVIEMFRINVFADEQKIKFTAALPFAIGAVVPDLLIAGSLCYFLNNGKQDGFRGTQTLINHLMLYAINRTLLTSAAAIAEMVTYAALPNSFAFLAVDFCIGKLYANSLLATLNTRKSLRGKGYDSDAGDSTLPSHGTGSGPHGGAHRTNTHLQFQLSNLRASAPKPSASMSSSSRSTDTSRFSRSMEFAPMSVDRAGRGAPIDLPFAEAQKDEEERGFGDAPHLYRLDEEDVEKTISGGRGLEHPEVSFVDIR